MYVLFDNDIGMPKPNRWLLRCFVVHGPHLAGSAHVGCGLQGCFAKKGIVLGLGAYESGAARPVVEQPWSFPQNNTYI